MNFLFGFPLVGLILGDSKLHFRLPFWGEVIVFQEVLLLLQHQIRFGLVYEILRQVDGRHEIMPDFKLSSDHPAESAGVDLPSRFNRYYLAFLERRIKLLGHLLKLVELFL